MRIFIVLLLFCSSSLWADSQIQRHWDFKVLVDDREVGSHQFSVIGGQGGWSVSSTMEMDFTILRIKQITYQHHATEQWQDGCLVHVSSHTKRQRKETTLQASLIASGLSVITENSDRVLEGCVRSFAYWNPELLQGQRLLNVETGTYIPVTVSSKVSAQDNITHITIAGPKISIRLQYDASGDWLSLQTNLKTGAVLKYQRI